MCRIMLMLMLKMKLLQKRRCLLSKMPTGKRVEDDEAIEEEVQPVDTSKKRGI